MNSNSSRRGFSLIELMTALAFLAVIATLTIPPLLKTYQRTSGTAIKNQYDAVKSATFLHFAKNTTFATREHPLTFRDGFCLGWDSILVSERLLDAGIFHQVRVTTVITNASYVNMNTHAFYQSAGIRPGSTFVEMVVGGDLRLAEDLNAMIDGMAVDRNADLKGSVIYDFGTNQIGDIHLLIRPWLR